MREMTMETFYIINQIPKINRTNWNLPWMSCIWKFRSLKISLEPLERSFHGGGKTEIRREASWDIWNSPFSPYMGSRTKMRRTSELLPRRCLRGIDYICYVGYHIVGKELSSHCGRHLFFVTDIIHNLRIFDENGNSGASVRFWESAFLPLP